MFVRKRDPRYKAYIAAQAKPPGKASPTPASGAVTPRKTAPKSTFVAQDWQQVAEPSDAVTDLEWARAEGAEDEEWECIACNKTFRSEAAWNSHERSKKHIKNVEVLRRQMEEEAMQLGLSFDPSGGLGPRIQTTSRSSSDRQKRRTDVGIVPSTARRFAPLS